MVKMWVNNTEILNLPLPRLIVGLDNEWRPVVFKCRVHTVSVLQLSVGKSCLVFQILHAKKIPLELIKFLENAKYMFVGVRLYNDVEKLSSDYDLKAMNVYYLQTCVADEAKQLGYVRSEGLVKRVIWKDMEKPKRIRMSRWDNRGFTRGQVSYASLDAYFSFEIGRLLSFWYYKFQEYVLTDEF